MSAECVHWWEIEPPNGPVCSGRCKYCGEVREFRNSYEEWAQRDTQAVIFRSPNPLGPILMEKSYEE